MDKFLLFCGALCSAGGSILMGISAGSGDKSKKEKIGDCLIGLSGILAGIGVSIGVGATEATESKKQKEKEEA